MSSCTRFVQACSLSAITAGLAAAVFATVIAGSETKGVAFAAVLPEPSYPVQELGLDSASTEALGEPLSANRRLGAVVASAPAESGSRLLVSSKKRAVAAKPARRASKPSRPWAGPWKKAVASWYGPGFYGRHTANGTPLTRSSMNVAHKTLKFGTRIQFKYRNRLVIAVVNDRGPFVRGREFDLGPGTARALGFDGVGTVSYRIINRR